MERLLSKKLDYLAIRLTELSDALVITRPTMYKYISLYEEGDYKKLSYKIKKLFDFIVSKKCTRRIELYAYILIQEKKELKPIQIQIINEVEIEKDEDKLHQLLAFIKGERK